MYFSFAGLIWPKSMIWYTKIREWIFRSCNALHDWLGAPGLAQRFPEPFGPGTRKESGLTLWGLWGSLGPEGPGDPFGTLLGFRAQGPGRPLCLARGFPRFDIIPKNLFLPVMFWCPRLIKRGFNMSEIGCSDTHTFWAPKASQKLWETFWDSLGLRDLMVGENATVFERDGPERKRQALAPREASKKIPRKILQCDFEHCSATTAKERNKQTADAYAVGVGVGMLCWEPVFIPLSSMNPQLAVMVSDCFFGWLLKSSHPLLCVYIHIYVYADDPFSAPI